MNKTTSRPAAPLKDVLYELTLAKDVPDAELLDDFVRRYPEHAKHLTDFAIELAVDSLRPHEPDAIADPKEVSPAVSRAMSKFQNALHKLQSRKSDALVSDSTRAATTANPFTKYDQASFRLLARDLKANSLFVCKLRDREIDPSTIPEGFRRHAASVMSIPVDALSAHLLAPNAAIPQNQLYKADQKPEAGHQQSYEEAVRNSGLSNEQQEFLLGL